MRKLWVACAFSLFVAFVWVPQSHAATSLRMQPLLYNEALAKGEKKKGFIDISNPTGQKQILQTSVQAFKQKDNTGGLEFFNNEQVSSGITPDLSEFELGPREAVRMFFLIDGTKLPEGDVFAAIFVATKANQESNGVAQSVKLGTLLTLVNGTPGSREASVTRLTAPFFQFGDSVKGSYTIKNTADPKTTTGFYPEVKLQLSPFGTESGIKSALVMAGVEREQQFSIDDSRFGFYSLTASYGESKQSKLLFIMTGIWKVIIPAGIVLSLLILLGLRQRHRTKRYYRAAR